MFAILAGADPGERAPAQDGLLSPAPGVRLGGAEIYQDAAVALAFEGTLYNAPELRAGLGAAPRCDGELIALLYRRHGLDFLKRVNGPLALSLYDKQSGRVAVATDRFGMRPVVYLAQGGKVACAGRIGELLALPGVDPGPLDCGALIDYLNLSAVPSPRTVYRGVHKLPPGYLLTLERGESQPRLSCYYDLDYRTASQGDAELLARLPGEVEQAVCAVVAAEQGAGRTVGAFLSGGTDSSTVTGMIARQAGAVDTFSIGFDEPGYNELDYARIAARTFGARHHEYTVTPADVLEAIPLVSEVYDEPFGNASAIPTYFCARLAREEGIETLLAGDGGDEIFGGNERYAAGKVFSVYHKVPAPLRRGMIEPLVRLAPEFHPVVAKAKRYLRRANLPQPDRFFSYNPVAALGVENIFSPDFLDQARGHDLNLWARELWEAAAPASELSRQLYLDMKFTITDNDLRKVTGMTEKAGMRVAYPLLDHRLVEFAAGLPDRLKVRGGRLRYAFKESLRGFLPPEIIAKQKHGFGLPIGVWIRTQKPIADFVADALLGPSCGIRPWLREGFLEEIFQLHRDSGATFYGDVIWHLLQLELWHRRSLGASRTALS